MNSEEQRKTESLERRLGRELTAAERHFLQLAGELLDVVQIRPLQAGVRSGK